jgi:hypothetical protein
MNVTALAECIQIDCGYNVLAQKSEIDRLSWRPLSLFRPKGAMALSVIRRDAAFWSLSEQSGQWSARAWKTSVAFDPTRTLLPFIAMSAFPPKA